MPSTARIIDTALSLRAAAPELWEQFVLAMREYAAASTAEMVRCPPELLLRAQGMAHVANEFAMVLANAHKLKDKIEHGQRSKTGPAGY
jgi:hypothetical protein